MGLWETSFVLAVLVIMFAALYKGIYTSEVVVFGALIVIWNAGIIDTADAVSGFNNNGMLAVGALFVVVKGIEKCQLVDRVARKVFGLKTSPRMGLIRMMTATYILSAFLNNTPIVAALIPVTRDWARMRGFAPSIFLMPLSFSCILGGLLTIIGTSTNLVVNGIIEEAGEEPIGFFEPGYVSLPIGIISILFLSVAAPYILPKHGGLFRLIRDRTDELITELQVEDSCSFVGQSVSIVMANLNLPQDTLIKIRRRAESGSFLGQPKDLYRSTKGECWGTNLNLEFPQSAKNGSSSTPSASQSFQDIYPVQPQERIEAEDILFLSCAQSAMIQFNSERIATPVKGLRILDVCALDLPGCGTQFFELVLGSGNLFDGAKVGTMRQEFAQHYGAHVIAVRRKGGVEDHNVPPLSSFDSPGRFQYSPFSPSQAPTSQRYIRINSVERYAEVQNQRVEAGDLVLVLAKDEFAETWKPRTGTLHSDFFLITSVGKVAAPIRNIDYIPVAVFVAMLLWVVLADIAMVQAAMATAVFLIAFGFISAKEAVNYVDWALLLLIGSSLGISKSIDKSGLAEYIAGFIKNAGLSPTLSLSVILFFCVAMTELITNNAAAALCTPLALSIAKSLDVSSKPFIIVVMMAASASFCTPIGYQTNTMVWAPGGYKFGDFLKLGFLLTILVGISAILLVPIVFPF